MQCAFKGCNVADTGFLSQSEYSNVVNPLLRTVSRSVITVLLLKSHQSSFWCEDTGCVSLVLFLTRVDGVILLFAWLATLAVMSSIQKTLCKALN